MFLFLVLYESISMLLVYENVCECERDANSTSLSPAFAKQFLIFIYFILYIYKMAGLQKADVCVLYLYYYTVLYSEWRFNGYRHPRLAI